MKTKPTLCDIVKEASNDIYKDAKSTVKAMEEVKKKFVEFGKGFAEGAYFVTKECGIYSTIAAHMLPTTIRKYKEKKKEDNYENKEETTYNIMGELTGLLMAISATALSTISQIYIYTISPPEYLLIPAATNTASVVYERVRHAKKKLIEKYKTEGIERLWKLRG